MKEKLTNNLGLKILALLFSIALWLIAININDPVSQDNYTINVQLTNTSVLTAAGKYMEIQDDSDRIKVTVRGTRTALSSFSNKDIVAVADVSKMTDDNRVPIELNTTKMNDKIESVKSDSQYVQLYVEPISRLQLPIEVRVLNSPAENYILSSTTTAQNVVIVSGPASVVNEVKYAAVEINVEAATSDVKISLPLGLYDADNEPVESNKISTSMSEVSTTATILYTKSVPVVCGVTGDILDGYVLNGNIESTPSIVTIAGKQNVIKEMEEIYVEDAVDITGCDSDAKASVNLNDYLPDNVTLVDDSDDGLVNVVVGIEKAAETIFTINESRIHITGVPEGYTITLDEEIDGVEIAATGLRATLNKTDSTGLVGIVDVDTYLRDPGKELIVGNMELPMSVVLPEGLKLSREVKVPVTVKKDK